MTTERTNDSHVFKDVLIEDARARAGDHPGLDALVDYFAGGRDPESEDRIRDHFAGCPECAAKALDIQILMEPDGAGQSGVADLEIESAWRALQSRLQTPVGFEESIDSRPRGAGRWPMALAASLLVATVGLSVWVSSLLDSKAELRGQVAELSEPRVNPPIVYLDGITRSEPAGSLVTFAPGQPFALLIAIPSTPDFYSSYEAVLSDDAGAIVWSGEGLELSEESTLRLWLPRTLLAEGSYELRIRGLGEDRVASSEEPVITALLRVVYR
jgi:hypothetical protein